MGANTKIEWAHHTFNPWVGCQKISDACRSCYAEGWAKRTGQAGLWRGERRRTSVENWREPLRWDRKAAELEQETGQAQQVRVFCASLADVFEDHPALPPWHAELWKMVARTPFLTWLLLTKRPENILGMVPPHWIDGQWPARVWVGTTVEHQAAADERIPHLLRIPAAVRFLSCEPLLGALDLSRWLGYSDYWDRFVGPCGCEARRDPWSRCDDCADAGWEPPEVRGIGWVIGGGESGPHARPTHPDWAQSLQQQCASAGVPFLWKQWGDLLPACQATRDEQRTRPVQIPSPHNAAKQNTYYRPGKAVAGRDLDGRTWDEVPRV